MQARLGKSCVRCHRTVEELCPRAPLSWLHLLNAPLLLRFVPDGAVGAEIEELSLHVVGEGEVAVRVEEHMREAVGLLDDGDSDGQFEALIVDEFSRQISSDLENGSLLAGLGGCVGKGAAFRARRGAPLPCPPWSRRRGPCRLAAGRRWS